MLAQIAGSGLALRQEGPENRTDDSEELLADMEERSHAADARTFMFEGLSPPPPFLPPSFSSLSLPEPFRHSGLFRFFPFSRISFSLSLSLFVSLLSCFSHGCAHMVDRLLGFSLSLSLSLSALSSLSLARARSLPPSHTFSCVRALSLHSLTREIRTTLIYHRRPGVCGKTGGETWHQLCCHGT